MEAVVGVVRVAAVRAYRTAKRDDVEPAIIKALTDCGCAVERVDGLPFDLLVLRAGKVFMLEVKSGTRQARRKGATADRQAAFRRSGWPVHVVVTPIEALRVVGLVDMRARAESNGAAARARIDADVARLTPFTPEQERIIRECENYDGEAGYD